MTSIEIVSEELSLAAPAPPRARRVQLVAGLARDPTTLVGLVLISTLTAAALLAPVLAPHDPGAVDVVRRFAAPSAEFPLGTDHLGRDVLSRLLFGARVSIGATLFVTFWISLIGVVLGMVAGYFGGLLDTCISRVIDVLLALPPFLLALAVTGVLGPGLGNLILAITLVWWASYARVVRGVVIAERSKAYVEAAQAHGTSHARILWRHLLPNIAGPVVVLTTLDLGAVLLGLSGLSFLGLGVKPPTPEWGAMLSEGKTYVGLAPNMMLFPGAAIFLMVLGFNLVGDGLRDMLDPRTRRVRRGLRRLIARPQVTPSPPAGPGAPAGEPPVAARR